MMGRDDIDITIALRRNFKIDYPEDQFQSNLSPLLYSGQHAFSSNEKSEDVFG